MVSLFPLRDDALTERDQQVLSWYKTAKECRDLAIRERTSNPTLARAANRKAVVLSTTVEAADVTDMHGEVEAAVCAVEEVRAVKKGIHRPAQRTRNMLSRTDKTLVEKLESVVLRNGPSDGFDLLTEAGMPDLTFESIVIRYASKFSAAAVAKAQERLNSLI